MKKISAEQLYEAMNGIGDDLLLRSEEESVSANSRKKKRKTTRVVWFVMAAAALVILGIAGISTLRLTQNTMSGSSVPAAGQYLQEAAKDAAKESAKNSSKESADESGYREESKMEMAAEADEAAVMEEAAESAEAEDAFREPMEAESLEEDAAAYAPQTSTTAADAQAFFVYEGLIYVESGRTEEEDIIGDYVTTVQENAGKQTDAGDYQDNTGTVGGEVFAVNGQDTSEMLCMPQADGSILLFEAREE